MYIAGTTSSDNFPTVAATTLTGGTQAFLANIKMTDSFVLVPIAPCRVADMPGGHPPRELGIAVHNGRTARFGTIRSCGVPSTAQAYSLNFTAFPRTGSLEFLTVWPASGRFQNGFHLIRWMADGWLLPLLPAGAGGAISVYASDDTDLAIDVNGYFEYPSNPRRAIILYTDTWSIATSQWAKGKPAFLRPALYGRGAARQASRFQLVHAMFPRSPGIFR